MSFTTNVDRFATAVRGHWRIENSIHWVLDVTFGEDDSRVRRDHAPTNFSLIRKLALNILKTDKISKKSMPQKMLKASLSPEYRESLLRLTGI